MDNDQTIKVICYGLTGLIVVYVFFQVLPYILVFLVLYGAWQLFQGYERSDDHRHRNHSRRRGNGRWRW